VSLGTLQVAPMKKALQEWNTTAAWEDVPPLKWVQTPEKQNTLFPAKILSSILDGF